jgi:proton-dependent oligopeptide transporter, POT family
MTDAKPSALKHASGLWVLVFTETWERFSHYGMRAILILYMTAATSVGGLGLGTGRAAAIFGGYMLAIYLFGLSGGQIADRFLGPKRTIILGGLLIAMGQFLLQVRGEMAVVASLVLIAIGTCLLKPNISASVGRLYSKEDPRRDGAFSLEYSGINLGATIAPIFCAFMAEDPEFLAFLTKIGLATKTGWGWAFGITGVGMLVALVNFLLRKRLVVDVSVPADRQAEADPAPNARQSLFVAVQVVVLLALAWMVISAQSILVQLLGGMVGSLGLMALVQLVITKGGVSIRGGLKTAAGVTEKHPALSREDWTRLGVVGMMLVFSLAFWALFQQAGSSLTLFARDVTDRELFGWTVPVGWLQSVNAVLIVALGPVFAWLWAKRAGKWPSSPEKFALALLFAALGFFLLVPASSIAQPDGATITTKVGLGWLSGVYLLHTLGELCLSPVGLSYVSKLAPRQVSSQLMGAWFFAIGIGSYVAGRAAGLMESMSLVNLFGLFAVVALVAGLVLWLAVSPVIRKLMGGYS